MPNPWPVLRLDEVESTNDLARSLALSTDDPPSPPLVLRADRQTRGRGRGSNAWWSDPGSLTFSVLLDPIALGLEDRHTPLSSLATAVAVVEAVRPRISRGSAQIRWPNDVEVDGRKVAGILPERVNGPAGPMLIIGIGLNVRTRLNDAPGDVRRMAASLAEFAEFADHEPSPDEQEAIFTDLLDALSRSLDLLSRDDPGLAGRWAGLDQLLGRPVRVDLGSEVVSGIGAGIGPDGGLRVEKPSGVRILYGGRVLRDG
ncbi:biotin--[acetyl-CoA-carboxylase] ligase [Tautonia plasticadhaerens]|uniref:biotin--[biotin carboxyl-carrier protein] ligase n=1 Tax=Tautonia plasticadhaerens TaxID=2527974 RepID=A0A518GXN0_9BACT|nr:biotin--[acetyl-CoA-carboxylase] ligase [Tautonia plasticadhaerens]QDV33350.1 Bifunctional ligase/repressor BirA [Tautonia plasticadhaerens]